LDRQKELMNIFNMLSIIGENYLLRFNAVDVKFKNFNIKEDYLRSLDKNLNEKSIEIMDKKIKVNVKKSFFVIDPFFNIIENKLNLKIEKYINLIEEEKIEFIKEKIDLMAIYKEEKKSKKGKWNLYLEDFEDFVEFGCYEGLGESSYIEYLKNLKEKLNEVKYDLEDIKKDSINLVIFDNLEDLEKKWNELKVIDLKDLEKKMKYS